MIALYVVFMTIMVCSASIPQLVASATTAASPLRITHGIASGDVTVTEAVIWARANRAAQMMVEYTPAPAVSWPPLRQVGPVVDAHDDFTGKVVLQGLLPDTRYVYWVRFITSAEGVDVVSEAGQFRTAPADGAARALTLVWWGDLGGQLYCVCSTRRTRSALESAVATW
jgi:alkaline phosphatase D